MEARNIFNAKLFLLNRRAKKQVSFHQITPRQSSALQILEAHMYEKLIATMEIQQCRLSHSMRCAT